MSYDFNKRSKSVSSKVIILEKARVKPKNLLIKKVYSPKHHNYNLKLIPSHETSSVKHSNNSLFKRRELLYNSYPRIQKNVDEEDIKDCFVTKQKKIYMSPMIIDNKKISFQRQKDKTIEDFSLFDDELVFKDLNKAYLEDEYMNNDDESSDEEIRKEKLLLFKEIEEASKELEQNLKNNQNNQILSRKMRFKTNK